MTATILVDVTADAELHHARKSSNQRLIASWDSQIERTKQGELLSAVGRDGNNQVIRRMSGKRRTKRRKDASEGDDKNRTKVSRVGRVIHCTNCHQEVHNKKGCKSRVPIQNGTIKKAANHMVRRGGSSAGRGGSSSRIDAYFCDF
ncbi:hypothetical protein Tco_0626973 [Tanacetum coccineum]|uniref:Uncharacterized protein n=1 Tax=Tanacetum coccineum TaxID=301880 RepID=A0ABQ4WLW7_9ASTR